MDKFSDECGIVGVAIKGENTAAQIAYFGLNGIQHRGQESAGIAIVNEGQISCYKDNGLVTDVFTGQILPLLKGELCLGHVNQKKDHALFSNLAQPFVLNRSNQSFAVSYNGGLVNALELRQQLEEKGAMFTTNSDSEIIAYLIAHNNKGDLVAAIRETMGQLRGGYAFAVMTRDTLYGVRDYFSIRPLCVGEIDGGFALASESCAIDLMGGNLLRDLASGEIVEVSGEGIISHPPANCTTRNSCIFEYVYFARPDSTIDKTNVFRSRELAGKILAEESYVDADLVLGVPDSGTPAATGFAMQSGIPYSPAMIKNKYIGRTYIVPESAKRETNVKIKLNPIKQCIEGRKIIIVDDSIVRGTTMRSIISTIRQLGAVSVHLRISSPPVHHQCFFGVDTPEEKDLIANNMSKSELAKSLGADSLEYISIDGLFRSVSASGNITKGYCTACFSGEYPNIQGGPQNA